MDENQTKEILNKYKVIAVVGLSKEPEKDSYRVSAYLQQNGYRIIPVNPFAEQVLARVLVEHQSLSLTRYCTK